MGFGTLYELYNDHAATITGLVQNDKLNSDDFMPDSTADESFFLRFFSFGNEGEGSGNRENAVVGFELRVLFRKKQNDSYPEFYKTMLNRVGIIEKSLISFGNTRGDLILKEEIEIETLSGNYELMIFAGTIEYSRSME